MAEEATVEERVRGVLAAYDEWAEFSEEMSRREAEGKSDEWHGSDDWQGHDDWGCDLAHQLADVLRLVDDNPEGEIIPGWEWIEVDGDVFVGRGPTEFPPGSPASRHPRGPIARVIRETPQ